MFIIIIMLGDIFSIFKCKMKLIIANTQQCRRDGVNNSTNFIKRA